jgi:hypothetical protein
MYVLSVGPAFTCVSVSHLFGQNTLENRAKNNNFPGGAPPEQSLRRQKENVLCGQNAYHFWSLEKKR